MSNYSGHLSHILNNFILQKNQTMIQRIIKSIFTTHQGRMVLYFLLFILLGFALLMIVLGALS